VIAGPRAVAARAASWYGWPSRTGRQAEAVMAKVDLEFLARQIERMINDLAGLKDDVMVLTARVERLDATVHSLVVEVRAMHSRHERLVRRVDRLEEQGSGGD
jgi:hypothetical protein